MAPGQPQAVIPQADIRITNVALGEEVADASGRTTVKFTYNTLIQVDTDDEEDALEPLSTTVLCSLTAGKVSVFSDPLRVHVGKVPDSSSKVRSILSLNKMKSTSLKSLVKSV